MRSFRVFLAQLAAGGLLLFADAASAAELTAPDRALLDQALQLDRVPEVIESSSQQLKDQMRSDQRLAEMPEDIRLKFTAVLTYAFEPRRMLDDVTNDVAKSFDRECFQAFVAAASSPTAKKMGDLVIAATTPEGRAEMFAFSLELQRNPPDPERVVLLLHWDDLTQSSEIAAEAMIGLINAIGGAARDGPQYAKLIEEARTNARNSMLLRRLYAFRSVSNQVLSEFVLLHEDSRVSKVSQVIERAIGRSLQLAMRRFFEKLKELDRTNPPPTPKPSGSAPPPATLGRLTDADRKVTAAAKTLDKNDRIYASIDADGDRAVSLIARRTH